MLTDNEILSMCRRQLENSIGSVGSDSRWDTTRMLDQYHGRPYGTEVRGRSKVVTREILEQVEWAMPSLLRVFASGERVVMFTPMGEDDIEQAEQETDYCNHVFLQENNGWDILNNWMRSALLERNSYVKVSWDTKRRSRVSTYEGLSAAQVEVLLSGAQSRVPTGYRFEEGRILAAQQHLVIDPITGMQYATYDVKVREVFTRGQALVEYVPREEVRVSKDARSLCLDDVTMVAHVRDMTVSDVIQMGVSREVAEAIPSDRATDLASNTVQYARQNERSTQRTEFQASDEAGRLVQIQECYIRLDVDEDGVTELRRIVIAGDRVLWNEEVEEQPFSVLCPIPQPGVHVGMGLGDLTEDIQLINTHLLRSMLDNLALTNNPEREVVWDNVEFPDDFTTSVVGGLKRVSQPGTVREISVPFTAGSSVPIMELLNAMKESRTGISRNTMGLDADTLAKSTMGAFSMGLNQANQRLETFARTFAETGITWMFNKLRAVITRHQDAPRVVRLRGKYVEVDPRTWFDRYDTTALVGLGTGNTAQTLGYLQALAAKQEEHMQQGSPMVGWEELYNTYERMVEAAGFKDATAFFARPDSDEFQRRVRQKAEQARAAEESQRAAIDGAAALQAKMSDDANATRMAIEDKKRIIDLAKVRQSVTSRRLDHEEKMTDLELSHDQNVPGSAV